MKAGKTNLADIVNGKQMTGGALSPIKTLPTTGAGSNNNGGSDNAGQESTNVAGGGPQESTNGSSNPPQYLPKPGESNSTNGGGNNNSPAGFLGELADAAGDALEGAGEAAGNTADAVNDAVNNAGDTASDLLDVAGDVADELVDQMTDAANPTGAVETAIEAGTKAGEFGLEKAGDLIKKSEQAGKWVSEQSGKANDLNNDIINSIGGESGSESGTTNPVDPFGEVVKTGKEAGGKAVNFLDNITGASKAAEKANQMINDGQEAGKKAGDWIAGQAEPVVEIVQEGAGVAADIASDPKKQRDFASQLKESVQNAATRTGQKGAKFAKDSVENAFDAAVTATGNDPEAAKDAGIDQAEQVNGLLNQGREAADRLANDAEFREEFAEQMNQNIGKLPQTGVRKTVDFADEVFETGVTAAGGDPETAKEAVVEAGNDFLEAIGNAQETANELATDSEARKDLATDLKNGVVDQAGMVKNKVVDQVKVEITENSDLATYAIGKGEAVANGLVDTAAKAADTVLDSSNLPGTDVARDVKDLAVDKSREFTEKGFGEYQNFIDLGTRVGNLGIDVGDETGGLVIDATDKAAGILLGNGRTPGNNNGKAPETSNGGPATVIDDGTTAIDLADPQPTTSDSNHGGSTGNGRGSNVVSNQGPDIVRGNDNGRGSNTVSDKEREPANGNISDVLIGNGKGRTPRNNNGKGPAQGDAPSDPRDPNNDDGRQPTNPLDEFINGGKGNGQGNAGNAQTEPEAENANPNNGNNENNNGAGDTTPPPMNDNGGNNGNSTDEDEAEENDAGGNNNGSGNGNGGQVLIDILNSLPVGNGSGHPLPPSAAIYVDGPGVEFSAGETQLDSEPPVQEATVESPRIRTDLDVLDIRFVDLGDAKNNLGPRFRITVKNHNNKFATPNVDVLLIGGIDLADDDTAREVAADKIETIAAGEIATIDIRLPPEVFALAKDERGAAVAFQQLAVIADSNEKFDDVEPENNVMVRSLSEVEHVALKLRKISSMELKPTGKLVLMGEGFEFDSGIVALVINKKPYKMTVTEWSPTVIQATVPNFVLTEEVEARLVVVRPDKTHTQPQLVQLSP